MNHVSSKLILAVLLGVPLFPARAGYFQAYKPPIEAKAGDVATGTVVRQDEQTLILNTTPCIAGREKQIVIFHSPFETKQAEPVSCPGGKPVPQITATQN